MSDFKKGETVYLKTKKFNNTPHTGKVVKVTDSHVHISSAGGTYKAPKNIVTREYKDSHLYKSVREEVQFAVEAAGMIHSVHVSTYDSHGAKQLNSPEFKKHVEVHGGEVHYASDKGVAFKFKHKHSADSFHRGIQTKFRELSSENDGEMHEEVAVNAAGAGNVAGLGVGPQGEPGVKKKKKNIMTFSRFMRK
jgi:hypothetical protein